MKIIDLRSDTVTAPTEEMRASMCSASVGDDFYEEDNTVIKLQSKTARYLGFEDSIFMPSVTMSNLVAIMLHCPNIGDEYIVGNDYHCYRFESGSASSVGRVAAQPVQVELDGTLDFDVVEKNIKTKNISCSETKLLVLENTFEGRILPMDYLQQARIFSKSNNIQLHLDGSRIFNATVGLNLNVNQISCYFDSISISLYAGLGAPAGSLLCGNQEFIKKARRLRKILGGGMRQVGILAQAGIYVLDNHIDRLADDHKRAAKLGEALKEFGCKVEPVQTNMVFLELNNCNELANFLFERGINIIPNKRLRLCTHLDIDDQEIDRVIEAFKDFLQD